MLAERPPHSGPGPEFIPFLPGGRSRDPLGEATELGADPSMHRPEVRSCAGVAPVPKLPHDIQPYKNEALIRHAKYLRELQASVRAERAQSERKAQESEGYVDRLKEASVAFHTKVLQGDSEGLGSAWAELAKTAGYKIMPGTAVGNSLEVLMRSGAEASTSGQGDTAAPTTTEMPAMYMDDNDEDGRDVAAAAAKKGTRVKMSEVPEDILRVSGPTSNLAC